MGIGLKIGVIATWLVAAIGFLFPADTAFGLGGRSLFGLLAVVHAVECVLFYGTLKRTGRPLPLELLQTMFFGVIHYAEAKAIVEAGDAAANSAESA